MDSSSLEALVYDPLRCSKLSIDEKRDLVYHVSNSPDGATEMLHAWSRHEILQILCAELGKERKYTGLTKSKIIEHLLKIVYEKKSAKNVSEMETEDCERIPKRQRKSDAAATTSAPDIDSENYNSNNNYNNKTVYCKNSACKAKLNRGDLFCKRCSCCICRQYDDNKDPSLWLICNSDPPFVGVSCGMSCHLECALRHENSGILKDRQDKGLDGSFCCVSCRKVNDLLGSWRKQLVVARDTRRVDILCYRLSLSQKILAGTKHYQNLCEDIDEAVKLLEEELGPLTGLPVKMARGIVNRLSSGPQIQNLCASVIESLDSMLTERVSDTPSDCKVIASKLVKFEDVQDSSLNVVLDSDDSNVGYKLWHRKADEVEYPADPTCRLFAPDTKFPLSNLTPATDYVLKVIIVLDKDREIGPHEFQFRTRTSEDEIPNLPSKSSEVERSQSPATNCSSLSNPSSVEDETNNNNDNKTDLPSQSQKGKTVNLLGNNNETSAVIGLECVPYHFGKSKTELQLTPCAKDGSGRKNKRKGIIDISTEEEEEEEPQAGSSSKKRSGGERRDEGCNNGIGDKDFEYYVKVIRRLECEGYIETSFRRNFLTWYSLRATPQLVRIVKVFIDTFIEDPENLAGQIVDTFSDVVSNKRCSNLASGFCMKLWH
ncbi:hypothetical protein ABFS82_10G137700 [Erythranthe guttata]